MKKQLLYILLLLALTSKAAIPVDFNKIDHWTGQGDCRAALVITRGLDPEKDISYVWGYRFDITENEDGSKNYPTSEDMFKAICSDNDNLLLLTQFTGQYGATVCGIGIDNVAELLEYLYFDFDMAKNYEYINFDYYNTSTLFGQKEAPGDNTPKIMQQAINGAAQTHYIQHPLDYYAYGYPAYDYDCWKINEKRVDDLFWHAGWYEGYWSYWTGKAGGEWSYSGTGYTGRKLSDGAVDGWTYTIFDKPGVGGFGEGSTPTENENMLFYVPGKTTAVTEAEIKEDLPTLWYSVSGTHVATTTKNHKPSLALGIYITKKGNKTQKIAIK